jgi:hypothetical protein
MCAAGTLSLRGLPASLPLSENPLPSAQAYLGFDANDYPGDAALSVLRKTFVFAGYWLNVPPGADADTWTGKRAIIHSSGFGFLVLFNGRLDKELKSVANAYALGKRDAAAAVDAARREGFPAGVLIFVDQEEGGRMLPEQKAYLYAWIDAVNGAGDSAGVYCSGIPFRESRSSTIITADDIRDSAGDRKILFFVYNDACPPSPGCLFPDRPPMPAGSGVPFAQVWQIAQSPRRKALTKACPSNYAADGFCYAPELKSAGIYVDVDSAASPDPSHTR